MSKTIVLNQRNQVEKLEATVFPYGDVLPHLEASDSLETRERTLVKAGKKDFP